MQASSREPVWSNLTSGTLGVVLGAIVTGWVAWRVTSSQTTRLLDEQREAAKEDRRADERDHLRRREERALGFHVRRLQREPANALVTGDAGLSASGEPGTGADPVVDPYRSDAMDLRHVGS